MVSCPICGKPVKEAHINVHIDSDCETHIDTGTTPTTQNGKSHVASFFKPPASSSSSATSTLFPEMQGANGYRETNTPAFNDTNSTTTTLTEHTEPPQPKAPTPPPTTTSTTNKRPAPSFSPILNPSNPDQTLQPPSSISPSAPPPSKRPKPSPPTTVHTHQPLADLMRPTTLSSLLGHNALLQPPSGILHRLITTDRIPSMILWGGPGTGKTTIARIIAQQTGARFVEVNSTSTGVADLKKIFADAAAAAAPGGLFKPPNAEGVAAAAAAGRKTILFCDEIHRFSRSQQDVLLGPVEAGTVTLVGATTENPSFKVSPALLSRCRVFTLPKLGARDVEAILARALEQEGGRRYGVDRTVVDGELVRYLAAFADGDARMGLGLLEMAMELSRGEGEGGKGRVTKEAVKRSLTRALVYDRAGDQHYDAISAFHKSVRGSDPDAALYYLARMLQSGEDPLYVARRMVVIASEDIGLADNSLLTLATATYAAAEKVGMPEARINLAHCAVALSLARKSTRAYRGLGNAMKALKEPGVAGLPIPVHLRNAPTRLMKEMGYGEEYKYNPGYVGGKVKQEYLPEGLVGEVFLEEGDFGTEVDEELEGETESEEVQGDEEAAEERKARPSYAISLGGCGCGPEELNGAEGRPYQGIL